MLKGVSQRSSPDGRDVLVKCGDRLLEVLGLPAPSWVFNGWRFL